MRIQLRQFEGTEFENLSTFGDKVTDFIEFGTVPKVLRFDDPFSGSFSDTIGVFIKIESLDSQQGIRDLKFYLINHDGLKDTEIRYYLTSQLTSEIEWDQMSELKEAASESEIINNRSGNEEILGLEQFSQFIYLKAKIGYKENVGVIGEAENFKFACQFKEIPSNESRIQTFPGRIQIKPNAQDQVLRYLPNVYDKSEESNNYRLLKICSLEKDLILYQGSRVQAEHWIDTASYVTS